MKLCQQIRKNRIKLSLSQEALAEEIYVTRQTISNWETGRNYPDIHSLLLLSQLFHVSLDTLVKGDLEEMRGIVEEASVRKMQQLGNLFTLAMLVMIISIAPLVFFLEWIGFAIWLVIVVVTFILAIKVEKIKKQYDVKTYREIVAFMDGQKLDEIEKARESGKRSYQQIVYVLLISVVTLIVILISSYILGMILK